MSRARSLNHLNAPLPLRLCEGDFLFLFQFRYSDVWKFFVIYALSRGYQIFRCLDIICDDLVKPAMLGCSIQLKGIEVDNCLFIK